MSSQDQKRLHVILGALEACFSGKKIIKSRTVSGSLLRTPRRGMLLLLEDCCFSCMNEQLKCRAALKEFVFHRALYSCQR